MPFKDNPAGQTHFVNDNCGNKKHNCDHCFEYSHFKDNPVGQTHFVNDNCDHRFEYSHTIQEATIAEPVYYEVAISVCVRCGEVRKTKL